MDTITAILAGIAGYFAIAWKQEKDKNDRKSEDAINALRRWAIKVGDKIKVPFDDYNNTKM